MSDSFPRAGVGSGSPFEEVLGFRRAVAVDERVVVSGTAPIEAGGGCAEGAEAQAERCLAIIAAALRELGATTDDVIRTRTAHANRQVVEATGLFRRSSERR